MPGKVIPFGEAVKPSQTRKLINVTPLIEWQLISL
jgi:hypothetical protein